MLNGCTCWKSFPRLNKKEGNLIAPIHIWGILFLICFHMSHTLYSYTELAIQPHSSQSISACKAFPLHLWQCQCLCGIWMGLSAPVMVNGLYLDRAFLILLTIQELYHSHAHRGVLGFSILPKDTLVCGMGETGIDGLWNTCSTNWATVARP